MKKYLFAILAIICTLSSCTNEDQIDIKYETTFKLMPSSVISGFKEYHTGDFAIEEGYKLRTSLFIYDKSGNLVDKQISFLDSYTDAMTVTTSLPLGEYISVATSDVVKYSNSTVSFEYWLYKDAEKLSTFNIVNTGHMSSFDGILGISSSNFTVDKQSVETIPIQPAGSLITYVFNGIHTWNSMITMGIYFSRSNDYLFFNDVAIPSTKIISKGTYNYIMDEVDLTNSYYNNKFNVYNYNFKLPDPEFTFRFGFEFSDNSTAFSNPISLNMEAGQQYLLTLNLVDFSYDLKLTNGTTKTAGSESVLPDFSEAVNDKTLHVKDLVKKIK